MEVTVNNVIAKIEDYLAKGKWIYTKPNESTWIINDEFEGIENLVVYYQEPIVIFRIKLMEVPSSKKEVFFEKLLTLNSSSMTHGAYAIEGKNVVIVDTLEGENLDFNEFQSSIESVYMALSNDYKVLKEFVK